MDNTNVLQILNFAAPYAGNFMRSILRLAAHLKAKNINTVYMFPANAQKREWARALSKTATVYFRSTSVVANFRLLDQIVKENNIGIIHTHFIGPQGRLFIKLLQMKKPFIKIVTHFHNHYLPSHYWIKEKYRQWLLDSNAFIGCGMSVAQDLRQAGMKNVYCVRNAIDFSRLDIRSEMDCTSLGIPDNANVVLMFGHDYFGKGVDSACLAIKDIAKKHNVILAMSISNNKDVVVQNIVHCLGDMPAWIVLLEPRDDIATYYQMAKIFISPSRAEGFCYSLVEASYCGCSIIASLIPGQDELKIPHTIYFQRNNADELQKAILEELGWSSEQKAKYSNEAKNYVKKTFVLEDWCENIIHVYEKV